MVSAAVVHMPKSFTYPFDYSILILVRIHPTLRIHQKLIEAVEIDIGNLLRPIELIRGESWDEIILRNPNAVLNRCPIINLN